MKQTKITKSARGEECTVKLDGCNPGPENEAVVFAHAPYHGRFGSRKLDSWGAYACMNCHDKLDGRTQWDHGRGEIMYGGEKATSAQVNLEKIEAWFYAVQKTQAKLIEKGLLVVKKPAPKKGKLIGGYILR